MSECENRNRHCVIVGGGPAGLMAASTLADRGYDVAVYDSQPTMGRKFLLAGLGGLNLTNAEGPETFPLRYGVQSERFAPMLRLFSPDDLRAWAAALGVETFEGSGKRIFPHDMKASGLLRAWLGSLAGRGVRFFPRHTWKGFDEEGNAVFTMADGTSCPVRNDAVLLALGGGSWPRVGTDGSWMRLLEKAGVALAPLRPSNCGFDVGWSALFQERQAGVPLKTIVLSFREQSVPGDMILSRYGIEGGCVYALSGAVRDAIDRDGKAVVHVDLRRDMTEAQVLERLAQGKARDSLSNRLRKQLNLTPAAISLLYEVSMLADLRHDETLARLVKAAPITLLRPRPLAEAISSAGGVRFEELDEGLMLKKMPGVFIAGEMMDWEAPTGGFLLQGCFSSGVYAAFGMMAYLAGEPSYRLDGEGLS